MQLHRIDDPDQALAGAIEANLLADLRSTQPQGLNARFSLVARDGTGALAAGLVAATAYGWLHVEILWVAAAHRRAGLGRRLMAAAEAEARDRGCHAVWLDTSSAAAAAFYDRLGYTAFGMLENPPGTAVPGHRRWFLQRTL
jgi:GNAT superfamily N-acetyltransferase